MIMDKVSTEIKKLLHAGSSHYKYCLHLPVIFSVYLIENWIWVSNESHVSYFFLKIFFSLYLVLVYSSAQKS